MKQQISAALFLLLTLAGSSTILAAQPAEAAGRLKIYFVDVEGGQATLFVDPAGKSLLIDTGWQGRDGRDADRIVAAAKKAGLNHIDDVLITHFHEDHVGGVPQLAARIPIGTFIDHGDNREFDKGITEQGFAAYQKLLATGRYQHITAKPGIVLTIGSIKATVISSDGQLLQTSLPGGGEQNSFCAQSTPRPADQTENARSLGVQITFGGLKILDLGDLTWDKEMQLMCPVNRLGKIDVFIVSHHGWSQSSSPALVDAIHARVAIMDNGEQKGGSSPTLETIAHAPGLEAMWQLHYSAEGGPTRNTPAEYIANPLGTDAANYLELIGNTDGTFDIFNSRTSATKHYGH